MIFLLPLLLAVNGLPLLLLRTSKKYWIISIPVWILLLGILGAWRIRDDRAYRISEKAYYASFGNKNYGTEETWKAMEKSGAAEAADSRHAFVGVGFQTICVFVLMRIGYRRTKDKRYKWGKWVFGGCTAFVILVNLVLTLVLGSPFS